MIHTVHADPFVGQDLFYEPAHFITPSSSAVENPTRVPYTRGSSRKGSVRSSSQATVSNNRNKRKFFPRSSSHRKQNRGAGQDHRKPLSHPNDPNCKVTPKKLISQFDQPKKNTPSSQHQESSSYESLPSQFKTGLSHLLQKMSTNVAGRQILEKLNMFDLPTPTSSRNSHLQLQVTPKNTDRLLRVLAGLKTSASGKAVLYQLGLGSFVGLPPQSTMSDYTSGVMRSDMPRNLDFTAYNFNGGKNSVDELIQYTVDRYRRRRRGPDAYNRAPGYIFTEMDMVVTADQWRYFYGNLPLPPGRGKRSVELAPLSHRTKRKAIKQSRYYWPENTIPYELDENEFSWSDVMLFERAMYEWEQATCIRFRMATSSDTNKIRFRDGPGCSSHVGMIGGTQNITLQGPCRIRRILLHEIGHALGLVHEHQRPDRDGFIRILYENARPGTEWDFKKRTWGSVVNHTVGYDYESVMHYGPNAFSMDRGRPTILARDTSFQNVIGKVKELSFNDKKLVNMMYKCNSHCSEEIVCRYGGYVNKDCKCACPPRRPNCQQVNRPPPVRKAAPGFNWIRLFQSFSWNALRALGLLGAPSVPPTRSPLISPHLLEQERMDSPIRSRQRSNARVSRIRVEPSRSGNSRITRTGKQRQPYRAIRHTNIRFKREPTKDRLRRSLFGRPRSSRTRVRTVGLYNRRNPWFGRRRTNWRQRNKLPRLSRSYFRSISNSDREARIKEIRYNSRRRRLNKSRYYWK